MSRTYLQHPELFPEMRAHDPYYGDHVRDSQVDKISHAMPYGLSNKTIAKKMEQLVKESTIKEIERIKVGLEEELRLLDLETRKDYSSASNYREIFRRIKSFTSSIEALIACIGLKD